jgi:hypothetical protein
MEPVGALENVMLKLGPARPMAVLVFETRPDLDQILAELSAVAASVSRLRKRLRPAFGWHWRQELAMPAPACVFANLVVLDDPALADERDFEQVVSKVMRLGLPDELAPWRAVVVNPGHAGNTARTDQPAISALILQFDHSIADGIRIERIIRMLDQRGKLPRSANGTQGHVHSTLQVTRAAFFALADDPRVTPRDIALVELPAHAVRRRHSPFSAASAAIRGAIADCLGTPGFLCSGYQRRGKALEVVANPGRRRAEQGNFIRFKAADAVPREPVSFARTWAYRLIEPTGPWSFGWGAPLPEWLLRPLLRFWYAQFDAFLSVIPGSSLPIYSGNSKVRAAYGIAPMLADLPACVTVYWGMGRAFACIQTGSAVTTSAAALSTRFAAQFNTAGVMAVSGAAPGTAGVSPIPAGQPAI